MLPPGEPLPVLWSSWSFHLPLSSKSPGSPVAGEVLVSPTTELFPKRCPLCHTHLLLAGGSHTLATFIDSGADVTLIDDEVAQQLDSDRVSLPWPVPASALDGHLLGTVTHQMRHVRMLLSGNHH